MEKAEKVSNETYTRGEGIPICRPSYDEFIRRLAKENNAVVVKNYLEHGIELCRKLKGIARITREI